MTPEDIAEAARRLAEAERTRRQIGLLSRQYPGMTLDEAYAVQAAFVAGRLREPGRHRIGWKIGLTSRAMQAQLGITTPDSGVLLDDMAFEDGATVPAGRFIAPRIEAELAFVMRAPLEGRVSPAQVLDAAAWVFPALEILDTRIVRADPETRQTRTIVDTVADNAANAGIVTGGRPMRPEAVDLRWCGAILTRDGVVEETGLGAGVLNDPLRAIAWLSARLAGCGARIEPGEVILSGSFIRAVECPAGSVITADFGALGTLSVRFA
jgi:2-oxo-hept-3-ene-1,7-dioate hydratase